MTAPWTPEMPLRKDASDEQIVQRYAHIFDTSDDPTGEGDMVQVAREFAQAVAEGGEPVAWRFRLRGAPFWHYLEREPDESIEATDEKQRLYASPAGGSRAEVIEECARVCEREAVRWDGTSRQLFSRADLHAEEARDLAERIRALKEVK